MTVESISEIVERVSLAMVANSKREVMQEPTEEMCQKWRDEVVRRTDQLNRKIGRRYQDATLENYRTETIEQTTAVKILQDYARNIRENIAAGCGIVLFGPSGTGKDHLFAGLAKVAITRGICPMWINGVDLHALMRDAIQQDLRETSVIEPLAKAELLVLSDPLPPSGVLNDYQTATMYRLIDQRYKNMLPVWCSLNVADGNEARSRIGAATVDRLIDGTLSIECKWKSYRRKRGQ